MYAVSISATVAVNFSAFLPDYSFVLAAVHYIYGLIWGLHSVCSWLHYMRVLFCCYLANVALPQFGSALGSKIMVVLALLCPAAAADAGLWDTLSHQHRFCLWNATCPDAQTTDPRPYRLVTGQSLA